MVALGVVCFRVSADTKSQFLMLLPTFAHAVTLTE